MICNNCGKEYQSNKQKICCSRECYNNYYVICEYCQQKIKYSNYTKHIRSHINGNYDKCHNQQLLDHDDLFCKYCKTEFKNRNALVQHEIRCKLNPNKIDTSKCFNNKNRIVWNKGLTKETNSSLQKAATKLSCTIKDKQENFKYIYIEHNNLEIKKWITYLNSLIINIPKYDKEIYNNSYYIICNYTDEYTILEKNKIFEHRYLMNLILNGKLDNNNTVHHIDNNGLNNSLNNLLVFETTSEHKRFHKSEYAWLIYNEDSHKFNCTLKK